MYLNYCRHRSRVICCLFYLYNFDSFPLPPPSNLTLWRARRKQRGWAGWRSGNALCCFNNSEWHSSGSCFIILEGSKSEAPGNFWYNHHTYWIFFVKFLVTIPPSSCFSSCFPGEKTKAVVNAEMDMTIQHLWIRTYFEKGVALNTTSTGFLKWMPLPHWQVY